MIQRVQKEMRKAGLLNEEIDNSLDEVLSKDFDAHSGNINACIKTTAQWVNLK
jgi:hypothetical protein